MKIFGTFEYKMPKACAEKLLKERKGEDKKKNPQEYLCQIINEGYGIKGTCVKVVID